MLGMQEVNLFLRHQDEIDRGSNDMARSREGHTLSCYLDSREGIWKKKNRNGTLQFCSVHLSDSC